MDRAAVDLLVEQTRSVIQDVALPLDDAHDGDIAAAGGEAARRMLQAGARAAGVFAPHAPVDCGGLGLSMVERARVFEEAGLLPIRPAGVEHRRPR